MAKTTKANGRAGKAKSVPRAPRQANLPGTDDRAIRDLEDAAQYYADIRRQRAVLQREEAATIGEAAQPDERPRQAVLSA